MGGRTTPANPPATTYSVRFWNSVARRRASCNSAVGIAAPLPPCTTSSRSCCTAHASISGCASFSTGWHSTLLPPPAKIPPTLTFVPSFQPCLATLHRGWAARERAPRICGYGFATDFGQVTKPRRGCEPRPFPNFAKWLQIRTGARNLAAVCVFASCPLPVRELCPRRDPRPNRHLAVIHTSI